MCKPECPCCRQPGNRWRQAHVLLSRPNRAFAGPPDACAPALNVLVSKEATPAFMDRGLPGLTSLPPTSTGGIELAFTRRPVRLDELARPRSRPAAHLATRAA